MRKTKMYVVLFFLFISTIPSNLQAYNQRHKGLHPGWYVSIEGFKTRLNDTFLNVYPYAISFEDISTGPIDHLFKTTYFYVKPDYDFGGRIAVGYDFVNCDPYKNYGISLEYTHFHQHVDSSTPLFLNNEGLQIPIINDGFSTNDIRFSQAKSKLNINFDTVDLLGHQNRLFYCNSKLQFFAGLRYLHLDRDLNNNYHFNGAEDGPLPGTNLNEDVSYKSDFDGIGTRFGTNIIYPLFCGIGISGEAAGSLLYGRAENKFRSILTINNTIIDESTTFQILNKHLSNTHVVPALSGKVALVYYVNFCNCSSLNLEAGYRGDKYFNVSNDGAYTGVINLAANAIQNGNYHSFEFEGPYVLISYHF